jgi:WD40 repeat protein
MSFSPEGVGVASASWDGTVRVWDGARGEELLTLKGQTNRVFAVAFSPDGYRLATTRREGLVQVWHRAPRRLR